MVKNKKEKEKLSTLGTVKKQVYEAVSFYENDWPNSHLSRIICISLLIWDFKLVKKKSQMSLIKRLTKYI